MQRILVRVTTFVLVLVVMWGVLLLLGLTGNVGELELALWLVLLIAAEWFAMRWSRRWLDTDTAPIDQ